MTSLNWILAGISKGCFRWCLVTAEGVLEPCRLRSRGGSGNTLDVVTAALLCRNSLKGLLSTNSSSSSLLMGSSLFNLSQLGRLRFRGRGLVVC